MDWSNYIIIPFSEFFYRFFQKKFLLQIMYNSGFFPFCSLTLNYAVFTRISLKP